MKFTLVLTEDMLKVVAAGLSELPLKHALSVLNELNRQIAEQSKPTVVEDKAA